MNATCAIYPNLTHHRFRNTPNLCVSGIQSRRHTSNQPYPTTNQGIFRLSKAFLIGFEMDYPNQTVNLRHVASVDR